MFVSQTKLSTEDVTADKLATSHMYVSPHIQHSISSFTEADASHYDYPCSFLSILLKLLQWAYAIKLFFYPSHKHITLPTSLTDLTAPTTQVCVCTDCTLPPSISLPRVPPHLSFVLGMESTYTCIRQMCRYITSSITVGVQELSVHIAIDAETTTLPIPCKTDENVRDFVLQALHYELKQRHMCLFVPDNSLYHTFRQGSASSSHDSGCERGCASGDGDGEENANVRGWLIGDVDHLCGVVRGEVRGDGLRRCREEGEGEGEKEGEGKGKGKGKGVMQMQRGGMRKRSVSPVEKEWQNPCGVEAAGKLRQSTGSVDKKQSTEEVSISRKRMQCGGNARVLWQRDALRVEGCLVDARIAGIDGEGTHGVSTDKNTSAGTDTGICAPTRENGAAGNRVKDACLCTGMRLDGDGIWEIYLNPENSGVSGRDVYIPCDRVYVRTCHVWTLSHATTASTVAVYNAQVKLSSTIVNCVDDEHNGKNVMDDKTDEHVSNNMSHEYFFYENQLTSGDAYTTLRTIIGGYICIEPRLIVAIKCNEMLCEYPPWLLRCGELNFIADGEEVEHGNLSEIPECFPDETSVDVEVLRPVHPLLSAISRDIDVKPHISEHDMDDEGDKTGAACDDGNGCKNGTGVDSLMHTTTSGNTGTGTTGTSLSSSSVLSIPPSYAPVPPTSVLVRESMSMQFAKILALYASSEQRLGK